MQFAPAQSHASVLAAVTRADGQAGLACRATRFGGRGARRGVTLMEAVLYIAVALGLIVGGLVFYQQASRSATYQSVVRGLQVVQSEVRAVYQVSKWPNQIREPVQDSAHITRTFIDLGAVPQAMIDNSGDQIRLTRDSRLMINHGRSGGVFQTQYQIQNVPEWLCTRMVVATITGGAASPGALGYGAMNDIASIQFGPRASPVHTHHFRQVEPPLLLPSAGSGSSQSSGDLTPELAAQICGNAARAASWGVLAEVTFITHPPS